MTAVLARDGKHDVKRTSLDTLSARNNKCHSSLLLCTGDDKEVGREERRTVNRKSASLDSLSTRPYILTLRERR